VFSEGVSNVFLRCSLTDDNVGLARLIPVAGCVALRPVKEKKEKNNNKEKKENTEKARVRPCVAKKRKRKQRTHKEERESDIGKVKRTH